MKKTIAAAFVLASLCSLHAQEQFEGPIFTNGRESFIKKDTNLRLSSFLGRNAEGKTHLSWAAAGAKAAGTFVVCRSFDSIHYEIIGIAQSEPSSGKTSTDYRFTDNLPLLSGHSYYKIAHLGTDNTCFISSRIKVGAATTGLASGKENEEQE